MSINFILPGMYEHFETNMKFLKLLKSKPEYFLPNLQIDAFYGNFQFCIWDGGRIFHDCNQCTIEDIQFIKNSYNDFNIPIRLIFTNTEIKEKHLYDRFCNLILQECENEINEVVVNSPLLEEYIKTNYPKYKFISSTTKCLNNELLLLEELNKDYHMICLDYNLNKNKKLLSKLDTSLKNKCEFLVNAICPAGCPNRKEHYKLNSLYSLTYGKSYRIKQCLINDSNLNPDKFKKNNLTQEECLEYNKNGFNHFKLEGRTFNANTLLINYVKYMVKPEYQLYVLNELLK